MGVSFSAQMIERFDLVPSVKPKLSFFENCARLVAIESIHRRESPNESEYTRFQRENFFHLKEFHIPPRSININ